MTASQLVLGVKLRDDARFDNFHGDRNTSAAQRLESVCQQPDDMPVVVLCGDADTGKSHLLQAVCHLGEKQGRAAVCISIAELEPFGPDALSGLETHEIVCLDDVDRIAGQRVWEEAIFHLYNRILDRGGLLLVSLADLPASLPFELPDLVSRFSHGLIIQLGIYRDEDRLTILRARAEKRGLVMADDVASYIMRRAPRRLGDLLGILDILDENSLQAQRRRYIRAVYKEEASRQFILPIVTRNERGGRKRPELLIPPSCFRNCREGERGIRLSLFLTQVDNSPGGLEAGKHYQHFNTESFMPSFVITEKCDGCQGQDKTACMYICPHDLMVLDKDKMKAVNQELRRKDRETTIAPLR